MPGFWVPALMAAGMVSGAMNARSQQKQQKAQNMAEATQTEYSPWTGMGAGQVQTGAPTQMGSALSGGIAGGLMGAQFDKPSADGKTATTETASNKYQDLDPLELELLNQGKNPRG
jgi:hypothetical protein